MVKNTLLQVWPIPAFDDNYIWCIHDGQSALIVDPGDAVPVLKYLEEKKLALGGILITHHHADHTGGILNLLNTLGPQIPVYGPAGDNIPGRTQIVKEGDHVEIDSPGISFQVFEVPGQVESGRLIGGGIALRTDRVFFQITAERVAGGFCIHLDPAARGIDFDRGGAHDRRGNAEDGKGGKECCFHRSVAVVSRHQRVKQSLVCFPNELLPNPVPPTNP